MSTATLLVFTDENHRELARIPEASIVPRAGEDVRLNGALFSVYSVGYEVPGPYIQVIQVSCRVSA
jgi:hypothetical protein